MTDAPPGFGGIDEFSLADSFVLRGFRLLQSAGLNAEEKRDILPATKGSLEFDVVTKALQTLWDEQFLGRVTTSSRSPSPIHYTCTTPLRSMRSPIARPGGLRATMDTGLNKMMDGMNMNGMMVIGNWHEAHHGHAEQPPPDDPQDKELQDSLQAEKEAEGLATQAQRTWSEAQRATAAIRRDRGFGQQRPSSSNEIRCFRCGGSHLARDCTDRGFPKGKGYGGGKGKPFYLADWETAERASMPM